jgi:hypothetical protein
MVTHRSVIAGFVVQSLLSRHLSAISIDIPCKIPSALLNACFVELQSSIVSISLPGVAIYSDAFSALSHSTPSLEQLSAEHFILSGASQEAFSRMPKLSQLDGKISSPSKDIIAEVAKRQKPARNPREGVMKLTDVIPNVSFLRLLCDNKLENPIDFTHHNNVEHLELRCVGPYHIQTSWPPNLRELTIDQEKPSPVPHNDISTAFCENLIAHAPNLESLKIYSRCLDFRRSQVEMLLNGLPHLKEFFIRNLSRAKVYDDESDEESDEEDAEVDFGEDPLSVSHRMLAEIPMASCVKLDLECLPSVRKATSYSLSEHDFEAFPNLGWLQGHHFVPSQKALHFKENFLRLKYLRRWDLESHSNYPGIVSEIRSLYSLNMDRITIPQVSVSTILASLPYLTEFTVGVSELADLKSADLSWFRHKALVQLKLTLRIRPTGRKLISSLEGSQLPRLEDLSVHFLVEEVSQLNVLNFPALRSLAVRSEEDRRKLFTLTVSDCPLLYRLSLVHLHLISWTVKTTPRFELIECQDTHVRATEEKVTFEPGLEHNGTVVVVAMDEETTAAWSEVQQLMKSRGLVFSITSGE